MLGAAQNLGEKSVVKVAQPSGTCQVELVGKTKGAFVINYEVRPPKGDPGTPPAIMRLVRVPGFVSRQSMDHSRPC